MAVQMEAVGQAVLDAALAEVKRWLRIETQADDAALRDLAASAISHAETFCGLIVMERAGTETLNAGGAWRRLVATPVKAVTHVRGLPVGGAPVALAANDYAIDIDGDGDAYVRVVASQRIEVHFTAGLAPDWSGLPEALRQGIVRLAAHLFSERDSTRPPAIVVALWQPWRRMRLS